MLKIKNYVRAESLEQAYELNQARGNRIIGGMLWMKMSHAQIQTAIDLSGLGLDTIRETEDAFHIGCMVTLRDLELHEGLHELSSGAVRESVKNIVGVQFRNLATIGGSLFGRFGFSDVLTCFLALDTYVELYKGGIIPLEQFAAMKPDNDILTGVIVKKTPGKQVYQSFRNTRTDFPVLSVAVSVNGEKGKAVIGARPQKAVCISFSPDWKNKAELEAAAEKISAQVPMGSNIRAGAEYRSHLAEVLLRRAFEKIAGEGGYQNAD